MEFQHTKLNPNYEISRQAAFLLQEFAASSGQDFTKNKQKATTTKAARPIIPSRFNVSLILGPFPDLLDLELLCWSANGHLPNNSLSRKTTQWFSGSHKNRFY